MLILNSSLCHVTLIFTHLNVLSQDMRILDISFPLQGFGARKTQQQQQKTWHSQFSCTFPPSPPPSMTTLFNSLMLILIHLINAMDFSGITHVFRVSHDCRIEAGKKHLSSTVLNYSHHEYSKISTIWHLLTRNSINRNFWVRWPDSGVRRWG